MNQIYTAIVKQDGDWWIGWVEELPGVNCQEATREELEFNRQEAIIAAGANYQELSIAL